MSDELIALFLALALFSLMAVWVPFLAYLQFIAHRESSAKDSAQIERGDSARLLKHQDNAQDEFSTRKVHPEEFSSAGQVVIDECANLSSVPRFEPEKSVGARITRQY